MAKTINSVPKAETKRFKLLVFPTKAALDEAIGKNGFCNPKNCWHKVAVETAMSRLEPKVNHHVRVDAGHVKLNYKGWRYSADTPKFVKTSLMLFDAKCYNDVQVKLYSLDFRRTTEIIKVSRERQDQINAARRERIAAGTEKSRSGSKPSMRKRVEGFSSLV